MISLLAVVVFGLSTAINAQNVAANSCSQTDVQTAIRAAASGDTVTVPRGNCSWSSMITVTKAIHIQGAGVGNTIITLSAGGLFFNPTTGEVSKVFEINGFTFNGNNAIDETGYGKTPPITGLKIHDNAFNNASTGRAIFLAGLEFGVIYHNTFGVTGSGNFIDIGVGTGSSGLPGCIYPTTLGSVDSIYVEDNTIGNGVGAEFVSETGQCGRMVFRHNTITGYDSGGGSEVFDVHGEQNSGGWTVSSEYYHNMVSVGSTPFRWMHLRGGQAVIMNNTISRGLAFNITEYQDHGGNGICNAYPIAYNSSENYCSPISGTCLETQIHNSFFFNNIAGGSQQTPGYTDATGGSCGSDPPWGDNNYIVQNREYWLPTYGLAASLPATCTADGNTYYGATDTDVIYKCTSRNTWRVFYQPYTYPHPLRTDSIAPPTNLTDVVK